MSTTSFTSMIGQTSATPQSPLGAIRETEEHQNQWVYIYNATGGNIPAGTVLLSAQTAAKHRARTEGVAVAGTLRSRVLGVAQTAIPQDHYGWVQRRGTATVTADGAVTAGEAAVCAAGGEILSAAAPATDALAIGHVVVGTGGAGASTVWLDL